MPTVQLDEAEQEGLGRSRIEGYCDNKKPVSETTELYPAVVDLLYAATEDRACDKDIDIFNSFSSQSTGRAFKKYR